jgi:hypothetical protein
MNYRLLLWVLCLLLYACNSSTGNNTTADNSEETPNTEDTVAPTAEVSSESEAADTMVAANPARNSAFEQKLSDGGVSFTVSSPNQAKGNTLTIAAEGLELRNETYEEEIGNYQIYRADIADLNQDGFPEVYIFARNETGKSQVYAYSSYRNRSYGQIYVPEIATEDQRMTGYQGGDQFKLQETALLREFPIYENGRASGSSRTLTYKLKMGEASYRLEAE